MQGVTYSVSHIKCFTKSDECLWDNLSQLFGDLIFRVKFEREGWAKQLECGKEEESRQHKTETTFFFKGVTLLLFFYNNNSQQNS